jgi:hypothetical protein
LREAFCRVLKYRDGPVLVKSGQLSITPVIVKVVGLRITTTINQDLRPAAPVLSAYPFLVFLDAQTMMENDVGDDNISSSVFYDTFDFASLSFTVSWMSFVEHRRSLGPGFQGYKFHMEQLVRVSVST